MASIREEILIDATVEEAWAALRDWRALDERLARGFVTATELEDGDRIVTFFNGSVVRERLVAVEEEARRLVWSIVDGPYTHHNGSAQVLPARDGRARFVWVTHLLPDELREPTASMMKHGLTAIKATLERVAAPLTA